jgi:high-affinity nickel permease
MEPKELSTLTDEELLQEAKKVKSENIINALFIGFLIGIACYSIAVNRLGLLAIIILYAAFRIFKRKKYDTKELDSLLKQRNLK